MHLRFLIRLVVLLSTLLMASSAFALDQMLLTSAEKIEVPAITDRLLREIEPLEAGAYDSCDLVSIAAPDMNLTNYFKCAEACEDTFADPVVKNLCLKELESSRTRILGCNPNGQCLTKHGGNQLPPEDDKNYPFDSATECSVSKSSSSGFLFEMVCDICERTMFSCDCR